jgi:putative ABC transport system permease protein
VRSTLVALETGLALVLLTGAGLLANSFVRLASVDPGFEPRNLAELRVRLRTGFDPAEDNLQFFEELSDAIGAIPGVESVAASVNLPVGRTNWRTGAITEVGNYTEDGLIADGIPVSPGYFSTMGIEVVAGREFRGADNTEDAVVVNRSFAQRAFPGEEAVGKRIEFGNFLGESHWHTIVGVVADVKQARLRATGEPAMFVPWGHFTWPSQSVVIRSAVPPVDLFPALRRAVWSIDPTLPIATVRTMEDRIAATIVTPRFLALVLGLFAGTALLLATVGIFGTTAYVVGRRRREVGIRIAMGAAGEDVARLMAHQGFRVVAGGLALGLVGSLTLTRVLGSILFEVTPTDPATLGAVVTMLALVGFVACYVPARRATRIDASETLRSE